MTDKKYKKITSQKTKLFCVCFVLFSCELILHDIMHEFVSLCNVCVCVYVALISIQIMLVYLYCSYRQRQMIIKTHLFLVHIYVTMKDLPGGRHRSYDPVGWMSLHDKSFANQKPIVLLLHRPNSIDAAKYQIIRNLDFVDTVAIYIGFSNFVFWN